MIEFYRGPKKSYSVEDHKEGIYFATDTKEILMGGSTYTGKQHWVDVATDAAAVSAVFANGGTIMLSQDISLTETLVVAEGKEVVLDLNNRTIRNSDDVVNTNVHAIKVEPNASLVIRGNGEVYGGSGGNNLALFVNGTCTIESGDFSVGVDGAGQGNACIEVYDGGKLYIKDGTFSTDQPYNGKYFVLNKKDGSNSVISVSGGTFINYDPSNSNTENPEQNFVAEGYKSVKIEGTDNYKVIPA